MAEVCSKWVRLLKKGGGDSTLLANSMVNQLTFLWISNIAQINFPTSLPTPDLPHDHPWSYTTTFLGLTMNLAEFFWVFIAVK